MNNTALLLDKGMRVLEDGLGPVDAERFIFTMRAENFDYTKWQHERYDNMTVEELNAAAVAYVRKHPLKLEKAKILTRKTTKAKSKQ